MSATTATGSTRIAFAIFLRLLGAIYLCAFVSLWVQIEGLVGERGIEPANELIIEASRVLEGLDRFHRLPTLYWLHPSDGTLHALCAAGTALAATATILFAPAWIYALLWLVYLSLYSIGGVFLRFQWDILLLETGVLAILAAPLALLPSRAAPAAPHWIVRGLLLWLLDRLIFASGAVKLLSGDPSWWHLTALTMHYETQPLPTWIGWWVHQLPQTAHVVSCVVMFVIEILVPPLIVIPGRTRVAAAGLFLFLQALIALTGNYGFFNLLSVALVVLLVDDRFWPARLHAWADRAPPRGAWPLALAAPIAAFLFLHSTTEFLSRFGIGETVFAPLEPIRRELAPFELTSGYGLFAMMTTARQEIVIEGSDDGETWREYRFRWKPGTVDRRPRFVAPHMPRLDWQMWFAALGDVNQNPWFVRLVIRLLEGSPPVLGLLAENPFPDRPPHLVRARLERYRFSTLAERRHDGKWWRPTPLGSYLPPVSLEDFVRDPTGP
ncbi:MAG: lipase maturation factor family protein [Candidatus Binatia bacterium]